jgi:hypothetical protein
MALLNRSGYITFPIEGYMFDDGIPSGHFGDEDILTLYKTLCAATDNPGEPLDNGKVLDLLVSILPKEIEKLNEIKRVLSNRITSQERYSLDSGAHNKITPASEARSFFKKAIDERLKQVENKKISEPGEAQLTRLKKCIALNLCQETIKSIQAECLEYKKHLEQALRKHVKNQPPKTDAELFQEFLAQKIESSENLTGLNLLIKKYQIVSELSKIVADEPGDLEGFRSKFTDFQKELDKNSKIIKKSRDSFWTSMLKKCAYVLICIALPFRFGRAGVSMNDGSRKRWVHSDADALLYRLSTPKGVLFFENTSINKTYYKLYNNHYGNYLSRNGFTYPKAEICFFIKDKHVWCDFIKPNGSCFCGDTGEIAPKECDFTQAWIDTNEQRLRDAVIKVAGLDVLGDIDESTRITPK